MRVLVLQALAGKAPDYPIQKGEQDLRDDLATQLISEGLAEAIKPEKRAGKATAKPKSTRKKEE